MRIRLMRRKRFKTFLVRFDGPCFYLGRNKVVVNNDLKLEGYYYVCSRYQSYRKMDIVGIVKAW